MFQIRFWYNTEPDDQNNVTIIALRYIDCGKETGLSINNMNNNYKYIITSFLLNTLLHHVGISWIIETHKQLKYDRDKYNLDWKRGGSWYNTSICKKINGTMFEEFIRNARTDRYIIM